MILLLLLVSLASASPITVNVSLCDVSPAFQQTCDANLEHSNGQLRRTLQYLIRVDIPDPLLIGIQPSTDRYRASIGNVRIFTDPTHTVHCTPVCQTSNTTDSGFDSLVSALRSYLPGFGLSIQWSGHRIRSLRWDSDWTSNLDATFIDSQNASHSAYSNQTNGTRIGATRLEVSFDPWPDLDPPQPTQLSPTQRRLFQLKPITLVPWNGLRTLRQTLNDNTECQNMTKARVDQFLKRARELLDTVEDIIHDIDLTGVDEIVEDAGQEFGNAGKKIGNTIGKALGLGGRRLKSGCPELARVAKRTFRSLDGLFATDWVAFERVGREPIPDLQTFEGNLLQLQGWLSEALNHGGRIGAHFQFFFQETSALTSMLQTVGSFIQTFDWDRIHREYTLASTFIETLFQAKDISRKLARTIPKLKSCQADATCAEYANATEILPTLFELANRTSNELLPITTVLGEIERVIHSFRSASDVFDRWNVLHSNIQTLFHTEFTIDLRVRTPVDRTTDVPGTLEVPVDIVTLSEETQLCEDRRCHTVQITAPVNVIQTIDSNQTVYKDFVETIEKRNISFLTTVRETDPYLQEQMRDAIAREWDVTDTTFLIGEKLNLTLVGLGAFPTIDLDLWQDWVERIQENAITNTTIFEFQSQIEALKAIQWDTTTPSPPTANDTTNSSNQTDTPQPECYFFGLLCL